MSRKLVRASVGAKKRRCLIRQPISSTDARLAAVMQEVKDRLKDGKPAKELQYLTDQPRSNCEKMVAGNRLPNPAMLAALFGSKLIIPAILALIPVDATDPQVRAVRKAVRRIELDFEDGQ